MRSRNEFSEFYGVRYITGRAAEAAHHDARTYSAQRREAKGGGENEKKPAFGRLLRIILQQFEVCNIADIKAMHFGGGVKGKSQQSEGAPDLIDVPTSFWDTIV